MGKTDGLLENKNGLPGLVRSSFTSTKSGSVSLNTSGSFTSGNMMTKGDHIFLN
jgi:hypothetical protein